MQQIKATFLEGYHSASLFCLTWFSAIHSFEVFLVSPICFIFQGQVTLHITSHNFHFLEGFVSSFKFSDKDFGNITSKTFLLATRLRGSDKTFSSGMNNFYFSITSVVLFDVFETKQAGYSFNCFVFEILLSFLLKNFWVLHAILALLLIF